jgi:RNA polymerase sigma factor (TIGR02999 family)
MVIGGQQHAITDALTAVREGVPDAMDRLIPLVYVELNRIAHRQLGLEVTGHTFSTTALVHEAYLRLVDQTRAQWVDRTQFFAVAANAMRRVLVDYARRHQAARRGGRDAHAVSLSALDVHDAAPFSAGDRADLLIAMDEALQRLETLDARHARVIECRFFGGLTEAETADVLGVTPRTVARDWVKARAWLEAELRDDVA